MASKNHGRAGEHAWLHEDFDDDPFLQDTRRRVHERKTAQLVSQAETALSWAIENELEDSDLSGLTVAEVRPCPDASHLLVVVTAPPRADLRLAEQKLRRADGKLREALGRAISRKRVPMLSFAVLPAGGRSDE